MTTKAIVVAAVLAVAFGVRPAAGQDAVSANQKLQQLEQQLALLTRDTNRDANATAAATVRVAGAAEPRVSVATTPEAQAAELERRIRELEQKIEQLLKEREAPKARLMNNEEQERVLDPVALSSFYDNGYLVLSSSDGAYKYWLDGRVNLDAATYRGSDNRLPTGFEVRRARIGVKATINTNWLAEVDLDFADNVIEMKDVWLGFSGVSNSLIRVGNHKAPFGLDTLTSSKNVMFIERSYLDSWSPDRLMGLSFSHWGSMYQFSGGVFGQAAGDFDDKDSLTGGGAGTSQGHSFIGRFSVAPWHAKGRVVHFGVAAARRTPDAQKIATSGSDLSDRLNASRVIKLDSRAETHVSRAKFLSTGDMKFVDHTTQLGIEAAGVLGPFTYQAEWQQSQVARLATTVATVVDHTFSGGYGQITWFATGERRPYDVSEGEFGRLIPKRTAGALEIGLRFSTLNLDDATAIDPILGGKAQNIAAGVTWFMNANHKLVFNTTWVNNNGNAKPGKDWAPLPTGTSTTQVPVYGDDFVTIAARYQIAF